MREKVNDDMAPDQRISRLLCRLQRTVSEPTFSYRLEGIRIITGELVKNWAMYRQIERQHVPGEPLNGRESRPEENAH